MEEKILVHVINDVKRNKKRSRKKREKFKGK